VHRARGRAGRWRGIIRRPSLRLVCASIDVKKRFYTGEAGREDALCPQGWEPGETHRILKELGGHSSARSLQGARTESTSGSPCCKRKKGGTSLEIGEVGLSGVNSQLIRPAPVVKRAERGIQRPLAQVLGVRLASKTVEECEPITPMTLTNGESDCPRPTNENRNSAGCSS